MLGQNIPAIDLKGTIVGALNLTVAEGKVVHLASSARILPPSSKNDSRFMMKQGGVDVGVWTQEANSMLIFTETEDCRINANDFVLRSGSVVRAKVLSHFLIAIS